MVGGPGPHGRGERRHRGQQLVPGREVPKIVGVGATAALDPVPNQGIVGGLLQGLRSTYADYVAMDGIQIAANFTIKHDDEDFATGKVESFQVNPDVDEALFQK